MTNTQYYFDIAWLLFASSLVFFMQAGFLALETGLTRNKNSINVAIKNIIDFGIAIILFWLFGFAFMFGESHFGLIGTSDFSPELLANNSWRTAFFIFQAMFVATAATIISGAVAERLNFSSYILITLLMSAVVYPIFGHWAWAGSLNNGAGWLVELGFVDFAGATVVHSLGGWAALAICIIIGPRLGRFQNGKSVKIHGHNLPIALLGVIFLSFGWIGFNGGSVFYFNQNVPHVIANTLLAGCSGMIVTLFLGWWIKKIPEISFPMNGLLAGLVSITASAHAVNSLSSIIIGAVSGIVMIAVDSILEKFKIDDAVGVIPVHVGGGVWGTIAVAFFGDYSVLKSDLSVWGQFNVQILGIFVCFLFSFGLFFLFFSIINKIKPLRVNQDDEIIGLNFSEHKATTEIHDLISSLHHHSENKDLSYRVHMEPFTEAGAIAKMYNKVMDSLEISAKEAHESQAMLMQTSKLATIGGISAGLVHEINQPLAAIRGTAQLILANVNETSPLRDDIIMIETQTERLGEIINNLRRFSRKDTFTMQACNINVPIQDSLKLLNAQFKKNALTVTLNIETELPKIMMDSNQIQQVVINLLTNACDASIESAEKTIWITAKINKSQYVEVIIGNKGKHIPEDILPLIFEPFFTTKDPQKGTGLGLSVSNNIIKNHKGKLYARNVGDDIVEIIFQLPLSH